MEYAVRLARPDKFPADPRQWCPEKWRSLLPAAPLKALYFGSEFCQDLLPTVEAAEKFCALAQQTGLEAVLLTPLVRADGLRRIQTLITDLACRSWTPTIVFNDLGVLRMLHHEHPARKSQAGRLFNRALRDPRLAEQPRETQTSASARGGQIRALLQRFDVAGLETDPDLEGSYLGARRPGLQRVLHLPYVFAASGRNCLLKADTQQEKNNFAKWLGDACPAPCRGQVHLEERADLDFPLWRAGNTLFYAATEALVKSHLGRTDRIVIHESPLP